MSEPRRLRVCHVSALPSKDPRGPVGGVGTYTVALLDMLSRGPLDAVVVCNADADVERSRATGAEIVPTWQFGDPLYPGAVARAVAGCRPDIVHVQQELFLFGPGPVALVFPLLLARLRKYRVVVTVHGVTTDREIDESLMKGRRSLVPLWAVRKVIVGIFRNIARSRAHLVVHGAVLKDRLIALGARPQDVTVIAHPLFTPDPTGATLSKTQARERLGLPADAHVVLTWGYWNGYKGVEVLAQGFARYRQRDPNAILILGTGPHPQLRDDAQYIASYDAEMRALSSHDGIVHAGFIDDERLGEYVRAADVCVFAYTKYLAASGPATYALTQEAPVLFSSVFADVPDELSFTPDPDGVDAALQRFFADPGAHAAAAAILRERASGRALLEQYVKLYGGVVE